MKLKKSLPVIVATICVFFLSCYFILPQAFQATDSNKGLFSLYEQTTYPKSTGIQHKNYKEALTKIDAKRAALAMQYQRAKSHKEAENVLNDARNVITQSVINDLFPFWYGTDWDFNGNTETPNQGKIACGYFVSTLLRDIGWKVERARLAQQASENIILSLTSESQIKRFRGTSIEDFVKALKNYGDGLYVVGLDIHTGFIVNTGGEIYFIHSSYIEPYKVLKERAIESNILSSSKYRVIGKLTDDDKLITKWFFKTEIPTRKR
jgi:hypothetical protein